MEDVKKNVPIEAIPAEAADAMRLHSDIMANLRTAAAAMVEFCRGLKEMRDRQLYTQLGFDSFGAYAEGALQIRQRQAYNYRQVYEKLSPQLLDRYASIGVTKLLLLTQVCGPDREEFAASVDLDGMTVEEIRALVKEKQGLAEQVSLLEAAAAEKDAELDTLRAAGTLHAPDDQTSDAGPSEETQRLMEELAQAKAEVQRMREEAEDVRSKAEADAQRLVREAVEAAQAESEKAWRKEKLLAKKEREQAVERARAEARKTAEAMAKTEAEQAAKKAAQEERDRLAEERAAWERQANEARERAAALEKELEIAGDEDTMRFGMLFADIQRDVNSALDVLTVLRAKGHAEQAVKLTGALVHLLKEAADLAGGSGENGSEM